MGGGIDLGYTVEDYPASSRRRLWPLCTVLECQKWYLDLGIFSTITENTVVGVSVLGRYHETIGESLVDRSSDFTYA